MKPSLFLAAVEATAKTVRTLLTTPQLTRPFREPFTPECMRGEEWLAEVEAEEDVLAPWWSVEAVKARARVETPLSATFTDDFGPCECCCFVCDAGDHCDSASCATVGEFCFGYNQYLPLPETSDATSATRSSVEDPPRGAEEAPRGADSPKWLTDAIRACEDYVGAPRGSFDRPLQSADLAQPEDSTIATIVAVLGKHRYQPVNHSSGTIADHCSCGERPWTEQAWRKHVAPLIAEALRGES